jgi:uncharacterized protein (TIGR02996 family)
MVEDQLVAQIVAAPDDPAVYLIYADYLQQRGDPRGRLIAIQVARAAADTPALEAEETALIAAYPPLRGPRLDLHREPAIAWANGFWRSIRVHAHDWGVTQDVFDGVATFLAAPSARFLRALRLEGPHSADVLPHVTAHAATLAELVVDASGCVFDDASLIALAACTRLRRLALGGCKDVTARGLAALRAMPDLASLELRECALDDAGAAELGRMEVREVAFTATGALSRSGVRALAAAPLAALHLDGTRLGDDHLEALAGHTTLGKLDLPWLALGRRGLDALAALPALRVLVAQAAVLAPGVARALGRLRLVRALDLREAEAVDDAALVEIATLPELRALAIGATSVRADTLAAVRGMKLRALDVSFLRLGGTDLRALADLRALEQLSVAFTRVGDRIVDVLLQLPRLAMVDLTDAQVSAAGLARLELHPTLEHVHVRDAPDLDLTRYA